MMKAASRILPLLALVLAFSFVAPSDASAQDPCNCRAMRAMAGLAIRVRAEPAAVARGPAAEHIEVGCRRPSNGRLDAARIRLTAAPAERLRYQ